MVRFSHLTVQLPAETNRKWKPADYTNDNVEQNKTKQKMCSGVPGRRTFCLSHSKADQSNVLPNSGGSLGDGTRLLIVWSDA